MSAPAPSSPAPRVLILGAHPDDADIKAGGTAALWCAAGAVVRLVSLTDGSAGHQSQHGPALAARRRAEAQAAAAVIGATYDVRGVPDGQLTDGLEHRHEVIRLIRGFRPDVVITHRTTDYHPDHRFTGLLVQDSAYLLTVPAVCPDVPHLERMPLILYFSDAFRRPCPFQPHVVVDIDGVYHQVVSMLDCHASQFYEWLPYNAGNLAEVPAGAADRRAWLADRMSRRIAPLADRYRELVSATYGDRGEGVRLIDAFEVSEYGAPLVDEARARLFPFLPATAAPGAAFRKKEWMDLPEEG